MPSHASCMELNESKEGHSYGGCMRGRGAVAVCCRRAQTRFPRHWTWLEVLQGRSFTDGGSDLLAQPQLRRGVLLEELGSHGRFRVAFAKGLDCGGRRRGAPCRLLRLMIVVDRFGPACPNAAAEDFLRVLASSTCCMRGKCRGER